MAPNLDFAQYLDLIRELSSKQTISDLDSLKESIADVENQNHCDPIGYQLANEIFFKLINNHRKNVLAGNFSLFYELSKVFHLDSDCQHHSIDHQAMITEECDKLTTYLQRYCSVTKSGLICQLKTSLKEDLIDQGNCGHFCNQFNLDYKEYVRLYEELISYLDGPLSSAATTTTKLPVSSVNSH